MRLYVNGLIWQNESLEPSSLLEELNCTVRLELINTNYQYPPFQELVVGTATMSGSFLGVSCNQFIN